MRKVTIIGLVLGTLALATGSYVLKVPKYLYTKEYTVPKTKDQVVQNTKTDKVVLKEKTKSPLLKQRKQKKQATYAKQRKDRSLHTRRPKVLQQPGPLEHNYRLKERESPDGN